MKFSVLIVVCVLFGGFQSAVFASFLHVINYLFMITLQ